MNKWMNRSPVEIDWSNSATLRRIVSLDCVYLGQNGIKQYWLDNYLNIGMQIIPSNINFNQHIPKKMTEMLIILRKFPIYTL